MNVVSAHCPRQRNTATTVTEYRFADCSDRIVEPWFDERGVRSTPSHRWTENDNLRRNGGRTRNVHWAFADKISTAV